MFHPAPSAALTDLATSWWTFASHSSGGTFGRLRGPPWHADLAFFSAVNRWIEEHHVCDTASSRVIAHLDRVRSPRPSLGGPSASCPSVPTAKIGRRCDGLVGTMFFSFLSRLGCVVVPSTTCRTRGAWATYSCGLPAAGSTLLLRVVRGSPRPTTDVLGLIRKVLRMPGIHVRAAAIAAGGMTREISGLGARGWPRVDKDCTPLALHQVRSRGGQRRACALALPGLRRPLGDPPLALGRREALGVFSHGLATADVFSPEPDGPHPRARRQVADALGWVGVNLQAALDGHLGTER